MQVAEAAAGELLDQGAARGDPRLVAQLGVVSERDDRRSVLGAVAVENQLGGLPGGAKVTLVENEVPSIAGVQWLNPQFSTNGFTVIAGETVEVDLDNPTQLEQGAFSIHKRLDGTGASKVPADTEFTVHYSYPAGEGLKALKEPWSSRPTVPLFSHLPYRTAR